MGDLSVQDDMALLQYMNDDTWIITIDPNMRATEKQAEMSLIHEMCHQQDKVSGASEGLDGHSDAWAACMLSVAKRGGFKNLW